MYKTVLIIVAILLAVTTAQPALGADTVFVMRHLQEAEGTDPPLSEQGAANAQMLAIVLGGKGINAIFATPTKRAMQTGQPLANKLGISITSYDPRDPAALVKAVADVKGPVLIVGHSNTVPDIVSRFGGAPVLPLGEQDYGTVFVVKSGSSAVEQIVLKAAP